MQKIIPYLIFALLVFQSCKEKVTERKVVVSTLSEDLIELKHFERDGYEASDFEFLKAQIENGKYKNLTYSLALKEAKEARIREEKYQNEIKNEIKRRSEIINKIKIKIVNKEEWFRRDPSSNLGYQLGLEVSNNTDNPILGILGTVSILDVFGEALENFEVKIDEPLPASSKNNFWLGYSMVNQNINSKLLIKNRDKIKFEFYLNKVIFSDGSPNVQLNNLGIKYGEEIIEQWDIQRQ